MCVCLCICVCVFVCVCVCVFMGVFMCIIKSLPGVSLYTSLPTNQHILVALHCGCSRPGNWYYFRGFYSLCSTGIIILDVSHMM